MLLIPIGKHLSRENFPYITALLIFVNCLVYFGWQSRDEQVEIDAVRYYYQSALPKLEYPAFAKVLRDRGDIKPAEIVEGAVKTLDTPTTKPDGEDIEAYSPRFVMHATILAHMRTDTEFMRALKAGQIITPQHPQHAEWQQQRAEYEDRLTRGVTQRFSFVPAEPTLAGTFGHMFLHGSFDHLLGNMIFLLLIGYLVEAVLGRALFLGFYLLGGLAAVGLFGALHADSLVPLVGASGAIAGLMGMYTVLFWTRRIEFFYWVLVYFDYFKAPAIVLLPLWLGKELIERLSNPGSHIAYEAHIGGLLGGAVIAGVFRLIARERIERCFAADDAQESHAQLHAKAREHTGRMEFERAAVVYEQLLAEDPTDRRALTQLYNISKHKPDSARYHNAAARLFALKETDAGTAELMHDTFQEYAKLANPTPKLNLETAKSLARRFALSGHAESAEKLLHFVLKKSPTDPALPELMLDVGKAWNRAQKPERFQHYLALVQKLFEGSDAARHAAQLTQLR